PPSPPPAPLTARSALGAARGRSRRARPRRPPAAATRALEGRRRASPHEVGCRGGLRAARVARRPPAGDVPCSADHECFSNLLAPVCDAGSGKCAASGAFRTTAGSCACGGGAAAGCALRLLGRTAGHAAGCLDACLAWPRCGAVEAVLNRSGRGFDCVLVDVVEADDPRHDLARSSTSACHWRILEDPLADDKLPDSLISAWFLISVVAMFSVMLLTCGVAICCCVRARGSCSGGGPTTLGNSSAPWTRSGRTACATRPGPCGRFLPQPWRLVASAVAEHVG
ncbi:unnamed protein product, partial [Prorocentrum cordatum]